MESNNTGAAEQLEGLTLLDKWKVIKKIRVDDKGKGSSCTACYRAVSPKGDLSFIKAFDFRGEELAGNTESLERFVREYNHEKRIHFLCNANRINRVTRIFGAGDILVKGEVVHFIICEWADKSLLEHQPPGNKNILPETRFTSMRDMASAISQLHQIGVAHQDVKHSNAVCFRNSELKLTDLGSSSCETIDAPPHDLDQLVGQPNYAPYEHHYDCHPSEWRHRRFGCDLFLLGNFCFTSFTGVSLSHLALHCIQEELRPGKFTGDYGNIIPHLIEAHAHIPDFLGFVIPEPLIRDVTDIVSSLCHPNPRLRGHKRNLDFNNQFGLERYITKFEILAKKARVLHRGIY